MKNTPFDLTGKVAVITGSSRGIGRSSAELLAKLGAKVVISSRKADACHEVAEGIKKAGGDAHVIPCNISRREEVEALISGTTKHYGKVDILVCNAAVNPYYGPLLDIKDEAFDKIMGSNVKSNIWLCALAIPQMAERGNGSVVIISSIGGLRGSTVIGAYGISKAADFALCRSLAGEWGPKGVRVNCVAPGLVKTDFARALWEDPENLKRRTATTPLRRIGEPDEIAGAVAYLGLRRLDLHDRPDHRGRRRRDDGGDVDSLPSPACGGGCRATARRVGTLRECTSVFAATDRAVIRAVTRATLPRKRERDARSVPPPPILTSASQSDCLLRNQQPPGKQRHVLCAGHRSGHHVLARHRVSHRHFHRRHRAAGIPAAFPGLGLGRARAGGHLDLDGHGLPRGAGKGGPEGKGHRRDRHHQPARDHRGVGPRHGAGRAPRHRLAGPPHRRHLRQAKE